ncbi:MAG: hypothetical protein WA430_04920 [Acidobacteriaceae bacterium]
MEAESILYQYKERVWEWIAGGGAAAHGSVGANLPGAVRNIFRHPGFEQN